ncbi:hypothetical protein Srot_2265 [Segniliparus rotundus DSM 44985]|uniref:Uncharacterized protein n=1 Tax=Segniliparus rotundus (strain ATCC BAA-972 / CDC 1076 / CIP 108378 / DSM 44985 / JCM 13578) TaxID=640132 RepID=D6ZA45_SEGRD|nr:hypothetical protein [Segniliparus rotundus]ADG98715.1 hypothetical protein Srot_2265 [Segniliparus rotundus DSM 44985]
MVEGAPQEQRDLARVVADLGEQNAQNRKQFAQTRLVAERLWELWTGEAAALLGAEWELADGRARALLEEEPAILALLPIAAADQLSPIAAADQAEAAEHEEWGEAELFELLRCAAERLQAQEQELAATLAARAELIGQLELHMGEDGSAYAAEHRRWLRRAEDVVQRLSDLGAGAHGAHDAYTRAGQLNTRMFRADLFAGDEPAPQSADTGPHLHGQLSPAGFYALADMLVASTGRLLKALIAAALALEGLGPLARRREHEWAQQYDQRSQAVFLLAGDCLHALGLLTRSVRQAGRNWEIAEFNAGGGRGLLPEAAKVKEVVDLRIAPPPSALARGGGESERSAAQNAAAIWRALAAEVEALDKALIAASGYDSAEGEALQSTLARIASRIAAAHDGAAEVADLCLDLAARRQLPWWRRGRLSR